MDQLKRRHSRRDAPYDAYADVDFFTDTNDPPTPPGVKTQTVPYIFPLLTTDALETANDQQNLNQLRQLGLSLAAATHNTGVQAGLDKLNQTLDVVNDMGSVGRASPARITPTHTSSEKNKYRSPLQVRVLPDAPLMMPCLYRYYQCRYIALMANNPVERRAVAGYD
jgi:hypothetical protein